MEGSLNNAYPSFILMSNKRGKTRRRGSHKGMVSRAIEAISFMSS